uniref:Uncharacterized protein n=1 Tax=Siphoviridae sp. ctzr51 TaxID=2825751 RepID=A0A8S5UNB1_9CAUD|nr:MAG TPA: hypothetical protein [Siphoviridae sp. ctzr51]
MEGGFPPSSYFGFKKSILRHFSCWGYINTLFRLESSLNLKLSEISVILMTYFFFFEKTPLFLI